MSKKNFSAVTAETGAPADDTNTTSADRAGTGSRRRPTQKVASVSYTHLTLPTICSV